MNEEIAKILANASPEVGKSAAFWIGFWEALPLLLMLFLVTWGVRTV